MTDEPALSQVKFDANKVQLNKNLVKSKFTRYMQETFGQWLARKRKDAQLNQTELAERSRVTKSTINLYEQDKIAQPRIKQIDKIAKALNVSVDEARRAAGPQAASKPTNLAELIQALEDLGLPVPMLAGGWEGLIKDDDGFEEALDRIKFDLEMVIRRVEKGRKRLTFEQGAPITLSDVDLDDLEHPKARKLG